MPGSLTKESIARAILHIIRYGDTDILPLPFESVFLHEMLDDIVNELTTINLDEFQPLQGIEMIAPKSRYGFRVAHQFPMLETILVTASAIEIGERLERKKRLLGDKAGPFAYRFQAGESAQLFHEGRRYRDWLETQQSWLEWGDLQCTHVLYTDIADFYQRIYFHRVENTLDEYAGRTAASRFIKRFIQQVRGRQSYGIPVGGTASRIIAESILTDVDDALANEEIAFTRYVDDYRIFVRPNQNPYRILAFLSEQLAKTEGLSLNAQKTRLLTVDEFMRQIEDQLHAGERPQTEAAIEVLGDVIYSEDQLDSTEAEQLELVDFLDLLQREMEREHWDFAKIKSIFTGLRFKPSPEASAFLITQIEPLMPAVKELVLYFDAIQDKSSYDIAEMTVRVSAELMAGASRTVPVIRVWLLELFVRGCLSATHRLCADIEQGDTLGNRQLFLIRGLLGDVGYFRRNKTAFEERNVFEKWHFIIGASCLPPDEFQNWIRTIQATIRRPLDRLFCRWALGKQGMLKRILASRIQLSKDQRSQEEAQPTQALPKALMAEP
jgi:hypothetical protein